MVTPIASARNWYLDCISGSADQLVENQEPQLLAVGQVGGAVRVGAGRRSGFPGFSGLGFVRQGVCHFWIRGLALRTSLCCEKTELVLLPEIPTVTHQG